MKIRQFGCLALLATTTSAQAELFWQTNSLSYLHGDDYKVGEPTRDILTGEHSSGWNWGDLFGFVDYSEDDSGSSWYGEFSPRVSLSWLSNSEMKSGIVKDVLIAATYEYGEGGVGANLIGPGLALNVPGFNYLSANLYWRDDRNAEGHSWQLTLSWAVPFTLDSTEWLFDGFTDIADGETGTEKNILFVPQLKLDLGNSLWHQPKQLYVGVEYQYWHPKFGIPSYVPIDTDEQVLQALVKWHF